MDASIKKKLLFATLVYWFLLVYIIGALVWWLVLLQKQNESITQLQLKQLSDKESSLNPAIYKRDLNLINKENKRNTTKYISEGITFLALILVGAVFVYRAVGRQLRTQQQQQNFMMAVTHELKTPIAVAKLNLETIQKHQLDDARRQKLIQMTLQEANRLNDLTNNILVSSQLEGSNHTLSKEELNLSDLVKSCVMDFKARFPDRNWDFSINEEIEITGDTLLLTILVNNLLENAMKYSPKNKSITCRLFKQKNEILLEVIDEGNGISPEEKKKVFDKFYRIGNESTRTTKGTGLGLYLCKKIALDHNADIYVTDNNPTGSIFAVSFKQE